MFNKGDKAVGDHEVVNSSSDCSRPSWRESFMRLMQKFKRDKKSVDEKFETSVHALEAWKKQCEKEIAQTEEAILNQYDSVERTDEVTRTQIELKKRRQQEDRALDAEIESLLKRDD